MFTRRRLLKSGAAFRRRILGPGPAGAGPDQDAEDRLCQPADRPAFGLFRGRQLHDRDRFLAAAPALGLDVEVIVKDSQSNPNRAAEVAKELIVRDEVNLILVASTPETTNPVCSIAETEEMPVHLDGRAVAALVHRPAGQPRRSRQPGRPFDYVYHFFWGLEDNIAVFINMWNRRRNQQERRRPVPERRRRQRLGDRVSACRRCSTSAGYELTDPGRYQNLTDDFSRADQRLQGGQLPRSSPACVIPPDFTTFWTQAKQQGFKPKVASVGKALLFPEAVDALGELGHNLSSRSGGRRTIRSSRR